MLGSLIEKEITTPEYYPLSLHALVAACNQKTNREPVTDLDEDTVGDALESLMARGLAERVVPAGSRVEKFEHRVSAQLNLGRRELALLDVLMLRGPQTVGELHARASRMHEFSDASEVEATLERLMEWPPEPLVVRLARAPGTREPRHAHTLSEAEEAAAPPPSPPDRRDELAEIRDEIARLDREVQELRAEFARFRQQFE